MTDAEYLRAITDHKIQIHCTEDMKAQHARLRAIADKLEENEMLTELAEFIFLSDSQVDTGLYRAHHAIYEIANKARNMIEDETDREERI